MIIKFIKKDNIIHLEIYLSLSNTQEFFYINYSSVFNSTSFLSFAKKLLNEQQKD